MRIKTTAGSIGTLLVAVIGIGYIRPPIPTNWKEVSKGMPREHVVSMFQGTIYTDMRELKGFDQINSAFTQFGFRKSTWGLSIYYDDSDKVKDVYARYIDPNCGVYNRVIKLQ